jgi:ferritin-like metal-binding protein YciE
MKQEQKGTATATASAASTTAEKETNTTGKTGTDKQQNEDNSPSLLEEFFVAQLKDMYYAEKLIQKSLPKMQDATTTEELKEAFEDHLHQTTKHVKRLEKVFDLLGKKAEPEKCEAMDGLVKETEKIIKESKEGTMTRDAALIIAAQKIEHYEIATYGGLVQLAITIGHQEVADTLDKTLMEEEDTDRLLTRIAEWHINIEAEEESKFSTAKKRSLTTGTNDEEEDESE